MSTKIKISLEDPETRAIWETALAARREYETWPAWKRGEPPAEETGSAVEVQAPAAGESAPVGSEEK